MGHFRILDFFVIGQGTPGFWEERGDMAWGLGSGGYAGEGRKLTEQ